MDSDRHLWRGSIGSALSFFFLGFARAGLIHLSSFFTGAVPPYISCCMSMTSSLRATIPICSGTLFNAYISKYACDILERFDMIDSKPVSTPLAAGDSLVSSGPSYYDPTLYRSIIGALQYLTITRPDLSFAVNLVSQFLQSPTEAHFHAVKRILRYVKGTVHYGLSFDRRPDQSILAYSDADWARCVETRRSTYGYSIFLGGNLVSWSAKKQPSVSRSSCESEYRALTNAASEVIWVVNLLRELQASSDSVPLLLCDNKSVAFLSQNPIAHKRAKHIDIDYHFVRELVSSGRLQTQFVPSHLQLADIFTKSLPRPAFELLRSKLCVCLHPTHRLTGGKSVKQSIK
ncbi:unnamed protein product [Cuscuta epithymum]|uniref:Uncharacterized protein n=1 Tax=Cuscuta epithymum TaxID=186058 RepID=A0AAV0EZD7_9ASTE|nr:unnamed protein product [Cuscuta epithymum]